MATDQEQDPVDPIEQAWKDMLDRRPIAPGDVCEVLQELVDRIVAAASDPNEVAKPFVSGTIQLLERVSLEWSGRSDEQGSLTQAHFILRWSPRETRYIILRVDSWSQSMGISGPNPKNLGERLEWTPEDGPQRPWVRQKLEQQIIEFFNTVYAVDG